ncbi:hypothetical protein CBR_g7990 [Chara braunii]|uniref:Uncharacterized protein n=1 Tax=Chara braunii TaxID=69332 RepID=A0A388KKW0_CHABU|nr:hypothetical protein CBR_g7990 [Chara braunii]|eukprot:GBG70691.1 hypothetical protein CBR_g7990 [Chara braunii]
MYNKFLADQEKETKKKEEEERLKKQKEEDERKEKWKKERQQLESEMGERIDKKLEKVCEAVKVNRQPDATGSSSMDNELAKLRRENEDLRKALLGEGEDDRVRKLQKEVNDLRKQVLDKSGRDDEMTALRHEIEQLRESTVKEQEIVGLKRLIEQLKTETLHWKDEALRSGNKRGNIVVSTPETSTRRTPRARWTGGDATPESSWRMEYKKLQSMRRVDSLEVEALKKKKAEAEAEVAAGR